MYRFNYIITIHNKQSLIEKVLNAVIKCCGDNSFIYPVLDGCTDGTEAIIDSIITITKVPIQKLYANDVHEILSLNTGLRAASQEGKGFNILLQDDVILNDQQIEFKIIKIYEFLGYEKVGVLAFRHGENLRLNHDIQEIETVEMIESWYGHGTVSQILPPGHIVKRMVGVRSPECISFEAVKKIGYMDEMLAPYTYDNHDFSIRCIQAGMENYVFAVDFTSDIKWGGMRVNPHPHVRAVMQRNRHLQYKKHYDYLMSFGRYKDYSCSRSKPMKVPGISIPVYSGMFARVWKGRIRDLRENFTQIARSLAKKILKK